MQPLELITNHPAQPIEGFPSLLLIHGILHGAWCWEEKFLPYLEQKGVKAYALSLSNHGNSPKKKPTNSLRISDYVEDVRQVIERIGQPVVPVGHSMGGFIVQKYLEKYNAPAGAVLLTPVPPFGAIRASLNALKKYPGTFMKVVLTQDLKRLFDSEEKYKTLFCTPRIDDGTIQECVKKIDTESFLAFLDMVAFNLVRTQKINSPLLIIGGEKDALISKASLLKAAKKYHTEAIFFEEMGHTPMISPDFMQVADVMIDWIATQIKTSAHTSS